MAADVSYLVRIMKGYKEDQQGVNESGKSTALITRDLLGGCCTLDSKELDLDLQVPSGWEKRLDLKSGKVYLQICSSPNSSSSSDHKPHSNGTVPNFQDLNFPPLSKQPLNLFDDPSLDLKLVPSLSTYRSVCTLDKVKSALERAEKETIKKRSISMSNSSSPPSNSSSSIRMDYEENSSPSFAAGCPSCLLYVLIPKNNPKCPRCHTIVPSPIAMKKPRIDLNISI
ncbi:Protein FAM84B like [Actinidia chinensis var. chinensis]|uniref:Protein FAM84B like n=1 Tax=Actinidia chinensis var. chinensis TaxID=1590841 RepID=A0A2R6QTB9_ACTCC|nr:Protein FAM84B like [Actinidia chinensis var. chinensis]